MERASGCGGALKCSCGPLARMRAIAFSTSRSGSARGLALQKMTCSLGMRPSVSASSFCADVARGVKEQEGGPRVHV